MLNDVQCSILRNVYEFSAPKRENKNKEITKKCQKTKQKNKQTITRKELVKRKTCCNAKKQALMIIVNIIRCERRNLLMKR